MTSAMRRWDDIKRLKDDLVSGKLTERQKFTYITIYIFEIAIQFEVFGLISFAQFKDDPNFTAGSSMISSTIMYALLFGGTYYFYKMNGGSRGKNFVERYCSIGAIAFVRLAIWAIPIVLVATIFGTNLKNLIGLTSWQVLLLPYYIYFLLVYLWMGKQVKEIAKVI